MANKAIFLDRDNTLIEDPGYINDPAQVKLLPNVSHSLIQLKKMGYKLVIVTNQSAVARGIISEQTLESIHQKLRELLACDGAYVDKIYYCPYHPDATVPEYRQQSSLRKPDSGMLLKAAEEMDLGLQHCWMVGNSYSDIAAGSKAGCRTILINSHKAPPLKQPGDINPDKKAVNITEAANIIKMYDRQNKITEQSPDNPVTIEAPCQTTEAESALTERQPEPIPAEKPEFQDEQTNRKTEITINQTPTDKTHRLLEEMLKHFRNIHRSEMFEEFSVTKLIAGIVQILVIACLLLSLWFLMDPTRTAVSVQTAIGYAIVLQLMVIAFYIMHNRR